MRDDKTKRKDEYDRLYDYNEEDSRNYEELYADKSIEDLVEELRGTIGRGECVYCGAKNAMEYIGGICFICKECGKSVHEDLYYHWAANYDIEEE